MVLKNTLNKFVQDVIPHNNRMLELRINGDLPVSIISIYAPQAGRPEEEKTTFYETLNEVIAKVPKKGPYIIMGDFNAKIQEPDNEEEEEGFGQFTFGKGTPATWTQSDEVESNREHMLLICKKMEASGNEHAVPKTTG